MPSPDLGVQNNSVPLYELPYLCVSVRMYVLFKCIEYLPVCMCACVSLFVASLVDGCARVYVCVCMYVSVCTLGALFLWVNFSTTVTECHSGVTASRRRRSSPTVTG